MTFHDPKCPACKGTGERDSGGVHPWGQPIMVPCDCYECQDCIGMKEYGCFCMANGASEPGGAFDKQDHDQDQPEESLNDLLEEDRK